MRQLRGLRGREGKDGVGTVSMDLNRMRRVRGGQPPAAAPHTRPVSTYQTVALRAEAARAQNCIGAPTQAQQPNEGEDGKQGWRGAAGCGGVARAP